MLSMEKFVIAVAESKKPPPDQWGTGRIKAAPQFALDQTLHFAMSRLCREGFQILRNETEWDVRPDVLPGRSTIVSHKCGPKNLVSTDNPI